MDRDGIFAGSDPFGIFARWMAEASEAEPNDPNAMTLATVDESGLPDARIVLLKGVEDEELVFFTNYGSRKGRQLMSCGKAALNFHWKSLRRQVRWRGTVSRVAPEVSDAYYATRPLGSRIGAWASRQSQPLESKEELKSAIRNAEAQFGDEPPRPDHWGGFKLAPQEIEFWADGAFRLHDRFRWTRTADNQWATTRLNP